MLAARCRWLSGAVVALLQIFACPLPSHAEQARVTFTFLPLSGAHRRTPVFTFDLVDAISLGKVALPKLTVANTVAGPRVTSYGARLPVLKLGGLAFTPSYGDQRASLDLLAAPFSGLAVDPRQVRGLSLSATRGSHAVTLVVGRLEEPGGIRLWSVVPQFLAVQSTLTAAARLTIAPRLVTAFGRSRGAETGVGIGARAHLARPVTVIADLGSSRTPGGRWMPLLVAGALGQWTRGALEASVRRAGAEYQLLGGVPFAGQDRELISGRLVVVKGVAIDAQIGRSQPHAARRADAHTLARQLRLRVEGLGKTHFTLSREQVSDRSHAIDTLVVEWRRAGTPIPQVRFEQREDQELTSAERRTLVARNLQLQGAAGLKGRGALDYRLSINLDPRRSSGARMQSRLTGRVTVTPRLSLISEADLDVPSTRCLRSLRLVSDISLARHSTLQFVYQHAAGSATPLSQRFEGRLTHLISF